MGANFSGDESRRPYPGFADIPENCITAIFRHLSPVDICKLAVLSWAFKNAASCDYVWQQKLPPCYQYMLDLLPKVLDASSQQQQQLSKKQIYALLCRPIPFDDGNKVVYVDKVTGGVCMSISAKAMTITGVDDHRYWNWIQCEESRFNEVAYLQQIWWLEVDGAVKFQFPAGKYVISFRLCLGRPSKRLGRRIYFYDQIHGWELKPVRFSLSTSEIPRQTQECYLEESAETSDAATVAKGRGVWNDYYVGEFIVHNDGELTDIKFSLTQIDCTHSKGGLCIDSVSIVPSSLWKGRVEVS